MAKIPCLCILWFFDSLICRESPSAAKLFWNSSQIENPCRTQLGLWFTRITQRRNSAFFWHNDAGFRISAIKIPLLSILSLFSYLTFRATTKVASSSYIHLEQRLTNDGIWATVRRSGKPWWKASDTSKTFAPQQRRCLSIDHAHFASRQRISQYPKSWSVWSVVEIMEHEILWADWNEATGNWWNLLQGYRRWTFS
jgi:hypothetical protein